MSIPLTSVPTPAIAMQDSDTGVTLTFDTTFALSAAIISVIRDLAQDEREEVIADMMFFASFARATPNEAKAQQEFWRTVSELFALEVSHPDAEQGDEAWHNARHLERMAAAHLDSAGIRDLHLPGCATFLIN